MKGRSCHSPGRIGPNAILRIMEALGGGVPLTREVLERAGLAAYLADPPTAMVEEQEVRALQRALRETVGVEQ